MVEFDPARLIREDLKALDPYIPQVHPGMIKLDANESPYDVPHEVKEYINNEMLDRNFNRYPDPQSGELLEALEGYTGYPASHLLAGNGSDEIIFNILLTFATGGKVSIATPTFSMYEVHSRVAGAEPVCVPRRSDFSVDVEKMTELAQADDTKIIFICSPNNPTANEIPREDLEGILHNAGCLVVVDEAYVEFGGNSCLPLLDKYPNLAVMRSFSKSFGLAGLRVGYLIARPEVVKQVTRVKQPFNLNIYAQKGAVAALKHLSVFRERLNKIIAARDYLYDNMKKIKDVKVYPTVTNFIIFRTTRPSGEIYRELLERGILIRNVDGPGLENCLRVSVGTDDENNTFLNNLEMIV